MTRVLGLTVGRNEAGRYLTPMLEHCCRSFDEHLFYDDRSDDDTPAIAESYGCTVRQRSSGPSFLEHEGQFRHGALRTLEQEFVPENGDWILSIDCDEMLVADTDPSLALRLAIGRSYGCDGIIMPIPEVFGWDDDGTPLVRTDGFWSTIAGPRFYRWRPEGRFAGKAMGCGSEPTYVSRGKLSRVQHGAYLMHFGYARAEDRKAKYARYMNISHGHADQHVRSIIQRPILERWTGPIPLLAP